MTTSLADPTISAGNLTIWGLIGAKAIANSLYWSGTDGWNYAHFEINGMNENQLVGGMHDQNWSVNCTAHLIRSGGNCGPAGLEVRWALVSQIILL